ncbi:MAG: ABC-type transport auxiliary lipoprotein family protein [Deltaproteobacteria bacterium]
MKHPISEWGLLLRRSLLLTALTGCALTSKAAPLMPRYFSPELGQEGPSRSSANAGLELRLGRIEASAHLEQRLAYRSNESELGYYDDWRWTQPPEAYLSRALAQQLFERGDLVHVVSGSAPTLDAELSSFEEIRSGAPRARVELRLTLRDERRTLLERTLRIERAIAPGATEDAPLRLTRALSAALEEAVAKLAELVTAELGRARSDEKLPRAD